MRMLTTIASALLVTGCAAMQYQPYAREVLKKPRVGGTIALHSEYRPEDRQRADLIMGSNCGETAAANVTQEGEAVVGERSNAHQNRYRDTTDVGGFDVGALHIGNSQPSVNTDAVTETTQVKEWRIEYTCVANNAPAPRKKAPKQT